MRTFLLITPSVLFAQNENVYGVILDCASQQKLEGATVRIDTMDASVNKKPNVKVSKKRSIYAICCGCWLIQNVR